MTDHLLPITAERLAGLPDHTPLRYGLGGNPSAVHRGRKQGGHAHGIRCYGLRLRVADSVCVWLDLSDLVTRAVVAARIVPDWYDGATDAEILAALGGSRPDDEDLIDRARICLGYARGMDPDMPAEHINILARLARAALEVR